MILTWRQIKEIQFAMVYAEQFSHGTDGHNRLLIIAELAKNKGFLLTEDGRLAIPPDVEPAEETGGKLK